MKVFIASISLLLLLVLGLISATSWIALSPAGSDWLVQHILHATGGSAQISGTLLGQLQLRNVQFGTTQDGLSCQELQLNTKLQQIFPLQLQITTAHFSAVQLNQGTAQPAQQDNNLSWPSLPWWLELIEIAVQQLDVDGFQLHQTGQEPFRLEQLHSRIMWRERRLLLSELEIRAGELAVTGELESNFASPALVAALKMSQSGIEQAWQNITLHSDLHAKENLLLSGIAELVVSDNTGSVLELSTELGLSSTVLQFNQLKMQRTGCAGNLTATGTLNFAQPETGLSGQLRLDELDLQTETGQAIQLSGELDISGTIDSYQGHFNLSNRAQPLLAINLSGNYSGTQQQLALRELQGNLLHGTIGGAAQLDWQDVWQLDLQLSGRKLNPQLLHEQLAGELNVEIHGQLYAQEQSAAGHMELQLHQSTLHGQPISGSAKLIIDNQQLEIAQLQLDGDGMRLNGSGKLDDTIHLAWQVDRLEQLLHGYHGRSSGSGWIKQRPQGLSIAVTSRFEQLAYQQWHLASGTLEAKSLSAFDHWEVQFSGEQLTGQDAQLNLEQIALELNGSLAHHQLNLQLSQADAKLELDLAGGLLDRSWHGEISNFSGIDNNLGRWHSTHSVALILSATHLQLDKLEVTSSDHGELQLQGHFFPEKQLAQAELTWQQLDLALLRPWLTDWVIAGRSSGSVLLHLADEQTLHGTCDFHGQLKKEAFDVDIEQGQGTIAWNSEGLHSEVNVQLRDGGQLQGQLSSSDRVLSLWPRQGKLHLNGQHLAMARLQPWLPLGLIISGDLACQTSAQWQPDAHWTITGSADVSAGQISRQDDAELISAQFSTAKLAWDWQEQLYTYLDLQLQERGSITAHATLPLSAQWPLQLQKSHPCSGDLQAGLKELGLLSMLFPERIQQSRGTLKLDLHLSGTLEQPQLGGEFAVSNGGAFLPTLGIELKDGALHSVFDNNKIQIKDIRLVSGSGPLTGSGEVLLLNGKLHNYQLHIQGQDFQLLNLPDLQAHVTPNLNLSGDLTSYRLRGNITIAQLLASSTPKTSLAQASPDLRVMDAATPPEKQRRLHHDIDIELLFGDKVLLNSSGIDARLNGELQLKSTDKQDIAAFGEIRVAKGKYSSYGVSLNITRGNLFFNGGALDQPVLDILALRKAGEVQAGVKVTGTPKRPVVKLYSEPVLADTDILSYIVLGRAVGSSDSQNSLLMTAADTLLSQGESVALQEKLKSRLGLDVIDISAGDGNVTSSIITTGKYLSPDLYVSLGYSLFSNSNEIKARYNLTPNWEIESTIGADGGVDMFYKLDIK